MDSAEKAIYTPIAEEAKRRGYTVTMTEDKFARCEIGFYCQHVNFPQYSKFSVVMLHDIIQQYSNWPDLWYREPWNKYDVGILPSNLWESNWKASSHNFYAHPKKGIYKIGWPWIGRLIRLSSSRNRVWIPTKRPSCTPPLGKTTESRMISYRLCCSWM